MPEVQQMMNREPEAVDSYEKGGRASTDKPVDGSTWESLLGPRLRGRRGAARSRQEQNRLGQRYAAARGRNAGKGARAEEAATDTRSSSTGGALENLARNRNRSSQATNPRRYRSHRQRRRRRPKAANPQ